MIKVAFSPKGGALALLLSTIKRAKKTIDAAVYEFTLPEIQEALEKKKIPVRILFDRGALTDRYSMYQNLLVEKRVDRKHQLMHNKYLIADGKIVLTGSFNWTKHAEHSNAENLIKVHSKAIALAFTNNFEAHWEHSK